MRDLVRVLVRASEKAANIARIIRQEEELFQLLIEEKESKKRNDTFVADFKTLADVLIQETVHYDVGCMYPDIEIFGEESNLFSNSNGENVSITVKGSLEETRQSLEKVLLQNTKAAELLSNEVYSSPVLSEDLVNRILELPSDLEIDTKLGIWIDPIDATSEYIKGQGQIEEENGDERIRTKGGLCCATVLIGVYSLETGVPMIGVINQPFWKFTSAIQRWTGRVFWGIATGDFRAHNLEKNSLLCSKSSKPVIMVSDNEKESVKKLLSSNFQLVHAPGAGYKLLCIIIGLADFYVLSKKSTYTWDTCAPHAILKSLGGGIECLEDRLRRRTNPLGTYELIYQRDAARIETNFANIGGLVAFRRNEHTSLLDELLQNDFKS